MTVSTRETRMATIKQELRSLLVHMTYENLTLSQSKKIIVGVLVEKALSDARGNQCKAAGFLGMHRNTLNRIMKLQGIKSPRKRRYDPARPRPEPDAIPADPLDVIRLRKLQAEVYPSLAGLERELHWRL